MKTKSIMVQGTASHVGKSVLVAALCRIFVQDGYRVAPFKSQNMALNSYVTKDGGEMGRAQAVQAEAAGIEPTVDMNPILLKPTGNASSQVVVLGRPAGNFPAQKYHTEFAPGALDIIEGALDRLRMENDLIIIEGAGSPAEVNLQEHEIVNMRIARMAGAPVLLVADIDKGGALASLVGTLELVEPEDRDRIVGFIINKFRGDLNLFRPAVDFLEKKTGKPVLGVVPYFQDFRIQEEDTIPEDRSRGEQVEGLGAVEIAVIRLPHISNFTDFDSLEDEPDVRLRYIGGNDSLGRPDLIILPGSKNTIEDLAFLNRSGLAGQILEHRRAGTPVIGICGGFQMLGRELNDPLHTESEFTQIKGLGLLDISTTFTPDKITNQVEAEVAGSGFFLYGAPSSRVTGYEIHMGRTTALSGETLPFAAISGAPAAVGSPLSEAQPDGFAFNNVFGSYLHGLFDGELGAVLVRLLLKNKGQSVEFDAGPAFEAYKDHQYNLLAQSLRENLDMARIYQIIGL